MLWPILVKFVTEGGGDNKPGDDEENINSQKAAGDDFGIKVINDDGQMGAGSDCL